MPLLDPIPHRLRHLAPPDATAVNEDFWDSAGEDVPEPAPGGRFEITFVNAEGGLIKSIHGIT